MSEGEKPVPGLEEISTLEERVAKPIVLKNNMAVLDRLVARGGQGEVWVGRWENIYAYAAELVVNGDENPSILDLDDIPYQEHGETAEWAPTPIWDETVKKRVYAAAESLWEAHKEALKGPGKDQAMENYYDIGLRMGVDIANYPTLAAKIFTFAASELGGDIYKESHKRFMREYALMRRVEHPNILNEFGMIHDTGQGYVLLTAHVEGEDTLESFVKRQPGRKLPLPLGFQLAEQIGSALSHCHDKGIIHRDMKPGNILIDHTPTGPKAIVCDFGISKDMDGASTQTSAIIGTAQYMSPEQARAEPATPKTDVYGLSTVLFEIVTGRGAYNNKETLSTVKQIGNLQLDHPTSVEDFLPEISKFAKIAIEVGRRKDPGKRWTMDQMLTQLRQVMADESYDDTEKKKMTKTELLHREKVLSYMTDEVGTQIHFAGYEEAIDHAKGLLEAGKYDEFRHQTADLRELIDKPVRYAPLKESLCSILLDFAKNRSDAGQHVEVDAALDHAKKYLIGLPDDHKFHTTCKGIESVFSKHKAFVNVYKQVVTALKDAQSDLDVVRNLKAEGKVYVDELSSARIHLSGGKVIWGTVRNENVGDEYEKIQILMSDLDTEISSLEG